MTEELSEDLKRYAHDILKDFWDYLRKINRIEDAGLAKLRDTYISMRLTDLIALEELAHHEAQAIYLTISRASA